MDSYTTDTSSADGRANGNRGTIRSDLGRCGEFKSGPRRHMPQGKLPRTQMTSTAGSCLTEADLGAPARLTLSRCATCQSRHYSRTTYAQCSHRPANTTPRKTSGRDGALIGDGTNAQAAGNFMMATSHNDLEEISPGRFITMMGARGALNETDLTRP